MVYKFGQTVWSTRAIGKKTEQSIRVVSSCQMETIMKVRCCSIKQTGKAPTSISQELHMLESGRMIKFMVMELNPGQIVSTIKAAMRED